MKSVQSFLPFAVVFIPLGVLIDLLYGLPSHIRFYQKLKALGFETTVTMYVRLLGMSAEFGVNYILLSLLTFTTFRKILTMRDKNWQRFGRIITLHVLVRFFVASLFAVFIILMLYFSLKIVTMPDVWRFISSPQIILRGVIEACILGSLHTYLMIYYLKRLKSWNIRDQVAPSFD